MNTTSSRPPWARWLGAALLATAAPAAMAAFSITTVHDNNNAARPQYVIDTDGGLVFKVRGWDSSNTTAIGDLSSMVYKGVEYATLPAAHSSTLAPTGSTTASVPSA